jgi:hypothetical protein
VSYELNNAENIFHILANLPSFLRKSILKNKLIDFLCATAEDKDKTIFLILTAATSVNSDILSAILKSWFEVLAELDTEKITAIFKIYCETIMKDSNSIERLDISLLAEIFSKLEIKQKEKLSDCIKEVFFTLPDRYKMLSLIPRDALEILDMT